MGKRDLHAHRFWLWFMFPIAIIGLITSIYLVYDHINPEGRSVCDLSNHVSCAVVNRSSFSEFARVPVAVFGVVWFGFLIALSVRAYFEPRDTVYAIFLWCIGGVCSVVYFLIGEYTVRAICPFCTIVHVMNVSALLISYRLYRTQKAAPSIPQLLHNLRWWVAAAAVLFALPVLYYNWNVAEQESSFYGRPYEVALCLKNKKATFYGADTCSFCVSQKQLFGDHIDLINFVNCPDHADVCREKKVESYPTWVYEVNGQEVARRTGVLSLVQLAEFYNCGEIADQRLS